MAVSYGSTGWQWCDRADRRELGVFVPGGGEQQQPLVAALPRVKVGGAAAYGPWSVANTWPAIDRCARAARNPHVGAELVRRPHRRQPKRVLRGGRPLFVSEVVEYLVLAWLPVAPEGQRRGSGSGRAPTTPSRPRWPSPATLPGSWPTSAARTTGPSSTCTTSRRSFPLRRTPARGGCPRDPQHPPGRAGPYPRPQARRHRPRP